MKALDKPLPSYNFVDHFVDKYETKDVDPLLHNITDPVTLSEWTQIQMENGYKTISFVNKDVSIADFKNPVFVKLT